MRSTDLPRPDLPRPGVTGLGPLRRAGTILLTTYKRDGTPVGTPVSIAFGGGRAFFRTYDRAWKSRRLRRDPRATAAAATFTGRVTGQPVPVQARLLSGADARLAARALARRHPVLQAVLVPLGHRLMRYQTLHYELLPAAA